MVQIAEVTGAVAVVVSLIYVGSEIRQNTLAIQDNSHQASLALTGDIDNLLWDQDFAESYEAGISVYSTLRGADKRRFDSFIGRQLNIWEYAFYARRRGVMEEENWNGWDRWYRSQLSHDAWQQVWAQIRHGYGDSLQAYADAIVAGD